MRTPNDPRLPDAATDPSLVPAPGYAAGQLARAVATAGQHADAATRARAEQRAARWVKVLDGMLGGSLAVGSRTPVADAPAWATLEVVTGGFATGALLAGGPLLAHERELLASIGRGASATNRAALNAYYLSEPGLRALGEMLRTGCYRIDVPEEGALLVVAWLLEHGAAEAARDVIDALVGFFDRLRFYPVPDAQAASPSAVVRLQTVGQTIADLEQVEVPAQVARMTEALRVWAPFGDALVALFLETVEGPAPVLRVGFDGRPLRRRDGGYEIDGGWPCRVYPSGWRDRARALLDAYATERAAHPLCKKPERRRENTARLRAYLERVVRDPAELTGRDVGMIRKVLASVVADRGAPGSDRTRALRAEQLRQAGPATSRDLAQALIARLRALPADGGIASLEDVTVPLAPEEAARLGVPAGLPVPAHLASVAARALEASIDVLVEREVIGSSEVLARVVPQITAQVAAAGVVDPELRRLYGAIYQAFRRRRSLLLLNLAHQVRVEELPWVAAIDAYRRADLGAKENARQTLEQLASLAVAAFPQVILPNKLLQEVSALARAGGLALPVVEEVAADIFMGQFSEKYLRAAQTAARVLDGTLYARYYGVPCARVRALDDAKAKWGTKVSPGFVALCRELAGAGGSASSRWSVAANGKIIEQEQVLTTHNLATLFDALALGATLGPRLPEMARRCFAWICRQHQLGVTDRSARLVMLKNTAYAWRQMLFFASLAPRAEQDAFVGWAGAHYAAQSEGFRRRFAPAMRGLELVAQGGEFDAAGSAVTPSGGEARRFLGWTTQKHWLLAD